MSSGASGLGTATGVGVTPPAPTTVVANAPVGDQPIITVAVVADAAKLAAQLGVARNVTLEGTSGTKVAASAKEFKVTLTAEQSAVLTNFVTYGVDSVTQKLGSGERLAVARDILETVGRVSLTAMTQIANGQKPRDRNLRKEQQKVPLALKMFQKITGKSKPNFKDAKQDLVWNTLMYRIRFPRDLKLEGAAAARFKAKNARAPKTPLDWAAVRGDAYVWSK